MYEDIIIVIVTNTVSIISIANDVYTVLIYLCILNAVSVLWIELLCKTLILLLT